MEAYAEDNVIKKRKMSFAMEDTPLTSLSFKLVPVHSLENEWSLFKARFRTVQEKDPKEEATTKRKSAASRHVLFFDGSLYFSFFSRVSKLAQVQVHSGAPCHHINFHVVIFR